MEELVIKRSRKSRIYTSIFLSFLSLIFWASAFTTRGFAQVFFAVGAIFFTFLLLRNKDTSIVISSEGISSRALAIGVVRWEDIEKVELNELNESPSLVIFVNDPNKYLQRLPRYQQAFATQNKKMGLPDIFFPLIGLEKTPHEILSLADTLLKKATSSKLIR